MLERDPAKVAALRAVGRGFVVTAGDATSFADTAAAVDATVEALGGIDVLATSSASSTTTSGWVS